MRLDRYLLKEIGLPFLASVFGVVLLVFLFQARRFATAAVGFGLTATDALVIFGSALPPFLVLAIPIAYLTSVLVGLGRLSQDLELTGLGAAGASPLRLTRVPMVLGVLVSLLAWPLAQYGEPYGLRLLERRLIDVGLRNLQGAIRPGVFNEDFRGSAVFAASSNPKGEVEDVLLYDERDEASAVLVTAESGRLVKTSDGLSLGLDRGELHLGTHSATVAAYQRLRFGALELALDAGAEIIRRTRFVSDIGQTPSADLLKNAEREGDTPSGRRFLKAFWRRLAFPAMATVFGILGAGIVLGGPPKARARNAILGLGAVIAYYFMTRVADIVVLEAPGSAFWATWAPNLLMLGVGVITLLRAGGPK